MKSLRVLAILPLIGAAYGCTSLGPVPVVTSAVGSAAPASESPPSLVRLAKPPPGYVAFCERSPSQCSSAARTRTPLLLDTAIWETLEGVNAATNLAIAPQADSLHYGIEEYWTIPGDGYGDCDDYVLAKRSALMEKGIPGSALSIAVVFTPRFVRHTVLVVATDKGNYVLDNLRNEIVTWDKTKYAWIKRQDPASGSGWSYF